MKLIAKIFFIIKSEKNDALAAPHSDNHFGKLFSYS